MKLKKLAITPFNQEKKRRGNSSKCSNFAEESTIFLLKEHRPPDGELPYGKITSENVTGYLDAELLAANWKNVSVSCAEVLEIHRERGAVCATVYCAT